MEFEAGTTIGPLQLVECLAQGATSSVWSAEHATRGRLVAVKFLSLEIAEHDPAWRQRIQREASIGARIGSEHVVEVFEEGETPEGVPFIVMELLEGVDLARAVVATGALSLHETVAILRQVATVLGRAHDLGIVHRDIKPDNVFLVDAPTLTVKVLDFGIAKHVDPKTRTSERGGAMTKSGAIMGTPEFMSPEQSVSARDVDYRSDLFSLGMVAYFALAGDLPFPTGGALPLWRRVEAGPAPIRRRRDDLPEAIEGWFRRALALHPEDRFASARSMADALGAIASPHIPEAAPTTRRFVTEDSGNFRAVRKRTPEPPPVTRHLATREPARTPAMPVEDAAPDSVTTVPSHDVPDYLRGSVTVSGSVDEPVLTTRKGTPEPPAAAAPAPRPIAPTSRDHATPPTPKADPRLANAPSLDEARVPLALFLGLAVATLGAAAAFVLRLR